MKKLSGGKHETEVRCLGGFVLLFRFNMKAGVRINPGAGARGGDGVV